MAEKIVSPGVFSNEIDASFLPAAVGDIGAAIVGPTVKGPAMIPTVVTSYGEFQEKFGDVFQSGSNYFQYLTSHAAASYLKHSGRLTVVRVLDGTWAGAQASISSEETPSAGTIANAEITFAAADFDTAISDVTFVTSSQGTFSFIPVGHTGSLPEDVAASKTYYFLTGSTLAANINNLVGEITGAITGTGAESFANKGDTKIAMSASVAGTDGNSLGIKPFNSSPGTLTGGTNGAAVTSFKLKTIADGAIMNNSGSAADTKDTTKNILISGSNDNVRWEVSTKNNKKGTFTLLIRKGNDTAKRKQILETWNNVSLDPNSTNYIGKMIGDQYASIQGKGTTDPFIQYTGNYPQKSKYVYVSDIKDTVDYIDENGNVRVNANSMSLPAVGSGSSGGSFESGDNGYAGFDAMGNYQGTHTTDSSYTFYDKIGQASQGYLLSATSAEDGGTSYMEALNLLSNADEYDINLLLLPGIVDSVGGAHGGIISKAIEVCEDRGDCFFMYDSVPHSTTNISTVTAQAETRDTNYGATYWPWVQINDPQTGKLRWVPPTVVMPGIYAFNDKVAAPWFAPAGLNRGGLDTVVQAARKLTHKNRDTLYESNVNPIATFPGQGVVVWGQKTLQKKASALDRVNVRRLLIKVKKFIAASSRFLVFEQNNAATRQKFLNIANPFLEQVQSQSGLNAFRVIMDDTNNTPDVVDRNILYGQIFLQPTRTAEFIVLDFTIQPTGAAFPE